MAEIIECRNGCGRAVDAEVYPELVRRDGTYLCGLDCSCGAPVPCPRVHVGVLREEDVRNLREGADVHGGPPAWRKWCHDLADRLEGLLPPESS